MEYIDHSTPPSQQPDIDSPETMSLIFPLDAYQQGHFADLDFITATPELTGGFVIVYFPRSRLSELIAYSHINIQANYPLVLGLAGTNALAASGILSVQQQPYLDLRGQGTLIALIDTGIDYTQEAFRYEDGTTRIRAIWDQTIPGAPPEGCLFGTEYTQAQINEALRSDYPISIVPQRDTVGHGTFLASVAASREPVYYTGAAPEAEIIAVKLRKACSFDLERFLVPEAQENAYSGNDVIVGIEYVLQHALSNNMPVAICLGLATTFGAHDGRSLLENYISLVAGRVGVGLCAAAGNEALARHHMQGRVAGTNETQNIEVLSPDGNPSLIIAVFSPPVDRLSVSVISPTGKSTSPFPLYAGTVYESSLGLERSRVAVEYVYPLFTNSGQLTWVKIYDPTPGIWTLQMHGDSVLDGSFHAYLPMTGFLDPGVAFLSPSPNATITLPGTAVGVICAGAYDAITGGLYANSSWGPTRQPALAPHFVAPGVNVSGAYPLSRGTMTGTSVAAAITTGACALMLQWGILQGNQPTLNTSLIRAYLIRGCERNTGLAFPNDQWGYGRLNLMNSLLQLRETLP